MFPGSSVVKNSPAGDTGDLGWIPRLKKIPWRRNGETTPVFLPWKFHGQKNLVSCSPLVCKELHMTEYTHTHTHMQCICVNLYIQNALLYFYVYSNCINEIVFHYPAICFYLTNFFMYIHSYLLICIHMNWIWSWFIHSN